MRTCEYRPAKKIRIRRITKVPQTLTDRILDAALLEDLDDEMQEDPFASMNISATWQRLIENADQAARWMFLLEFKHDGVKYDKDKIIRGR